MMLQKRGARKLARAERPHQVASGRRVVSLVPRRQCLDRQSVDAVVHEVAERGVNEALAGDARVACEGGAFDRQREVAFAARVMTGVANVVRALVLELKARGAKRLGEEARDFGGDGGGGSWVHAAYIGGFGA